MATKRRIGRGIDLSRSGSVEYPSWAFDPGMSNRVSNQLVQRLKKWDVEPDSDQLVIESRRVFVNHPRVGLMVRPQFLDAGYASFCLAGIRIEGRHIPLVDILTDLVEIALENRLPCFMFECFCGDFAAIPRRLGARELSSPGDFIIETERLQRSLQSVASEVGFNLELPQFSFDDLDRAPTS